jgi:hypothetical protein
MFVKRYILMKDIYQYHDTVQMDDTVENLRMICKSHKSGTKLQYHVTGIHNQARFIGFSAKYDKVKI